MENAIVTPPHSIIHFIESSQAKLTCTYTVSVPSGETSLAIQT